MPGRILPSALAILLAATPAFPAMSAPAEPSRPGMLKKRTNSAVSRPGEVVAFDYSYPMGSIVVVNSQRRLYYVLGGGKAIRYPIAIGVPKEQWEGQSFVRAKAENPSWVPPWAPDETVPGGPGNPLGERALYLDWSLYRIHGTNAPGSIGRAASHGCFRMLNAHVRDLYERVHIGAPVYVTTQLKSSTGTQ